MSHLELGIAFFKQDEEIDHWALYLNTDIPRDCDIWQASGQTFEFVPTHIRGTTPESVPNFKEKWVLKENLTQAEVTTVRGISTAHPVDNDGAYWDCRIFCFEILASLEEAGVLNREHVDYRGVRRRLHEKWRTDDGVSNPGSDLEEGDDDDDEVPDPTRVNDSDLEEEAATNGVVDVRGERTIATTTTNFHAKEAGRKRALSSESTEPIKAESASDLSHKRSSPQISKKQKDQ